MATWLLIFTPFLSLFMMIRNLSSLAWLSLCANFLMGFAIVSIFFYLITHTGSPSGLPWFTGWSVFPLFFGVAVFAFEAIPIVRTAGDHRIIFPNVQTVNYERARDDTFFYLGADTPEITLVASEFAV